MPTTPEIDLVVSLVDLSNTMLRTSRRLFRPFGLTEAQFNVLHVLANAEEPLTQRALGDILVVDRSNVTGLVDRMETAGWVQRQSVPTDRRAYRLRLTAAGRRRWQQVYPVYRDAAARVVGSLPAAQHRAVRRALATLQTAASTLEASLPAK